MADSLKKSETIRRRRKPATSIPIVIPFKPDNQDGVHDDERFPTTRAQEIAQDCNGSGEEELSDLVPDASPEIQPNEGPEIMVSHEEWQVANQTVQALTADRNLYQRAGKLVRVVREHRSVEAMSRPANAHTIAELTPANLRERMSEFAQFYEIKGEDDHSRCRPPSWLIRAVYDRGVWEHIPYLAGISDVPILRSDGTIWSTPGYDSNTCMLYQPLVAHAAISNNLTLDGARDAANNLLNIVADFPFERPEHQSAWLAGLLTPLARPAFSGPSPLFLIDGNRAGVGKGLLGQIIGSIVLGDGLPVSGYSHDTSEMRKLITSVALAGDRLILLDNVEGAFGNEPLNRALTSTWWLDRPLGRTAVAVAPMLATWLTTGNNVMVVGDMLRRVLHIRLRTHEEHPDQRSGFRHPNLLDWVKENRGQFVNQGLAILAAYCRAGKPRQDLQPFGSFEGWSELVRSAIVWAGLPDPCLTRSGLQNSTGTDGDLLGPLISAWRVYEPSNRGLVMGELLDRLYPRQGGPPSDEASITMRTAVENFVGCRVGQNPEARTVGNRLSAVRDRVVDGACITAAGKGRNGMVWKIRSVRNRGEA